MGVWVLVWGWGWGCGEREGGRVDDCWGWREGGGGLVSGCELGMGLMSDGVRSMPLGVGAAPLVRAAACRTACWTPSSGATGGLSSSSRGAMVGRAGAWS